MTQETDVTPMAYSNESRRKGRKSQVLLIGYGASGQRIADTLLEWGNEVVVIEKNEALANQARTRGCKVVLGDARDAEVLDRAHVDRANHLAVTTTHLDEGVIRGIRRFRPHGVILTHLPTGFREDDDPTTRMIRRIRRMLDSDAHSNPAARIDGEARLPGASLELIRSENSPAMSTRA